MIWKLSSVGAKKRDFLFHVLSKWFWWCDSPRVLLFPGRGGKKGGEKLTVKGLSVGDEDASLLAERTVAAVLNSCIVYALRVLIPDGKGSRQACSFLPLLAGLWVGGDPAPDLK